MSVLPVFLTLNLNDFQPLPATIFSGKPDRPTETFASLQSGNSSSSPSAGSLAEAEGEGLADVDALAEADAVASGAD